MPDDKLYYGSGVYTKTDDAPTVDYGIHIGTDANGTNIIDTPDGHYVQTDTQQPPHAPNWSLLK